MKTYTKAEWFEYKRLVTFTGLYTPEHDGGPAEYFFEDGECSCIRRFSDDQKKVVHKIGCYDECSNCEGHGVAPIPWSDLE